jgi:hypothetical protein
MKQGHLPEPCGSRNEACSRSGAHSGGLSDGRSRSRRTPEAFARASRAPPRSQRPGTVAATGSSNARCSVRRDGGQTHAPHLSRASKLVGECMRMSPDESRSTFIRIGSPKKRWNISAVCGSAGSNSLAGPGSSAHQHRNVDAGINAQATAARELELDPPAARSHGGWHGEGAALPLGAVSWMSLGTLRRNERTVNCRTAAIRGESNRSTGPLGCRPSHT